MMIFTYPNVAGGYHWNMIQRIKKEVGIEPDSCGLGDQITLAFSRELTEDEVAKLNALMADDPTLPPKGNHSKMILQDVYNRRVEIAEQIGMPFDVYFTESSRGSGDIDQVELHFPVQLTASEKQGVLDAYLLTIKML